MALVCVLISPCHHAVGEAGKAVLGRVARVQGVRDQVPRREEVQCAHELGQARAEGQSPEEALGVMVIEQQQREHRGSLAVQARKARQVFAAASLVCKWKIWVAARRSVIPNESVFALLGCIHTAVRKDGCGAVHLHHLISGVSIQVEEQDLDGVTSTAYPV